MKHYLAPLSLLHTHTHSPPQQATDFHSLGEPTSSSRESKPELKRKEGGMRGQRRMGLGPHCSGGLRESKSEKRRQNIHMKHGGRGMAFCGQGSG